MQNESRPTAKQLLISWQQIWSQALIGQAAGVRQAIASHAQLFPTGYQAEARQRVERIVKDQASKPESIRALLNRGKAILRNS